MAKVALMRLPAEVFWSLILGNSQQLATLCIYCRTLAVFLSTLLHLVPEFATQSLLRIAFAAAIFHEAQANVFLGNSQALT